VISTVYHQHLTLVDIPASCKEYLVTVASLIRVSSLFKVSRRNMIAPKGLETAVSPNEKDRVSVSTKRPWLKFV
jgi:hypothetical protein